MWRYVFVTSSSIVSISAILTVDPRHAVLRVDLDEDVNARWSHVIDQVHADNPTAIPRFLEDVENVLMSLRAQHPSIFEPRRLDEVEALLRRRHPDMMEEEDAVLRKLQELGIGVIPHYRMSHLFYALTHLKVGSGGSSGTHTVRDIGSTTSLSLSLQPLPPSHRACTGILGYSSDGTVCHGRNFDYLPISALNVTRQILLTRGKDTVVVRGIFQIPFISALMDGTNAYNPVHVADPREQGPEEDSFLGAESTFTSTSTHFRQKQDPFSFSINERDARLMSSTEELLQRLHTHTLTPLVTRFVFQACDSFSCALNYLAQQPIVSEAYFLLASRTQGVVLTKNVHGSAEDTVIRYLSKEARGGNDGGEGSRDNVAEETRRDDSGGEAEDGNRSVVVGGGGDGSGDFTLRNLPYSPFAEDRRDVSGYLVETNYDSWNPAPAGDDRRGTINGLLRNLPQHADLTTELMPVLLTSNVPYAPSRPCLPGSKLCTLHSVVMCPGNGFYDFRLHNVTSGEGVNVIYS